MENTVLIRRAQAGERESREVLIEQNLGLVHHIVKRFLNRGYEAEDLFQIGVIGLIKAIDKFDTGYEVKFSTYAVPLITGEIKRFIRDDGLVKVSRTLKENGSRVKYARERLLKSLGREPTLEEVALEAALTTEEVILAMEAGARVESIYQSVYQSDGNEIYLVDQLADEKGDEQEKLLDRPAAVAISKTSGLAGIAYWINQNYRLRSDHQLSKHDALVEKLKVWVDEQYAGGRTTALSNEELEEKIAELSGGVLKPRH